MGATEFVTYGPGSSLDEAFTLARAEAGWSGGYEYPGSIAAKNAAKKILSTPMPRNVAYEYANDLLSADGSPYGDKWDHYCYAIPVCADSAFTKTRTIKVPVTTTEEGSYFVRRDALATLSPEDRKAVISVNIPNDFGVGKKCKVSVEATQGKAVMRYRVCDSFGHRTLGTYNTQSEARRALKQHIIDSHAGRDELIVIGVRERENGDPLVRATKTILPTAVTVSVTLGAPKHNYAPEGWIFFGVAPS